MRYVTFQYGHRTAAGLVRGQFVYDLGQAFFRHFRRPYKFVDMLDFLRAGGPEKIGDVDFGRLKDDRLVAHPLKEIRLRAPILRPPKLMAVGLNYHAHAAEQNKEAPREPLLFSKASNAVIGDGDSILIPVAVSEKIDPEVELGVVIGRDAWQVPAAEALETVFGYTIVNDVSARDLQASDKQWFRAKSCATFAPMGPAILTPDEFDPADAELTLSVGGERRQTGRTSDLIHKVPDLIAYVTRCIALEPGDVIATGTPAGVGVFRKPPLFLQAGDVVTCSIQGIGQLTNPVERGE